MFAENKPVNLKMLAERVGLAPCSVSAILNNTKASQAIPQSTKDRVYRAASELNYRPNHWARSLRIRQTRMVAVVAPGLSRPVVAMVVAAAQRVLHQRGYLLVLISSDSEDGDRLSAHLKQRGIEGVISIDAMIPGQLGLPVVSVDVGLAVSNDSIAPSLRGWFVEVGKSAAESIVRAVENPDVGRWMRLDTTLQLAPFEAEPANPKIAARAKTA